MKQKTKANIVWWVLGIGCPVLGGLIGTADVSQGLKLLMVAVGSFIALIGMGYAMQQGMDDSE